MEAAVLPHVELLTREGLLTFAEVTGLVGQRISTQLPESPTFPHVTLRRFGGRPPVPAWLDAARVQFDAWGSTETEASLVARTVRACCWRLNNYRSQHGVITGVADDESPRWLPDDTAGTTPIPRFVFSLVVYAHPTPGGA